MLSWTLYLLIWILHFAEGMKVVCDSVPMDEESSVDKDDSEKITTDQLVAYSTLANGYSYSNEDKGEYLLRIIT